MVKNVNCTTGLFCSSVTIALFADRGLQFQKYLVWFSDVETADFCGVSMIKCLGFVYCK